MREHTSKINFHRSLGEVMRAWRQKHEWTVTEFAKRANTAKGYISEVENNKIHRPNDTQLLHLAEALAIPVEYLVLRRFPDDLSPDEQKTVEEAWGISANNKQIEEKVSDVTYASPQSWPEPQRKKEAMVRRIQLFIEGLHDEEQQLQQQQVEIRQRLAHIKKLQALAEAILQEEEDDAR